MFHNKLARTTNYNGELSPTLLLAASTVKDNGEILTWVKYLPFTIYTLLNIWDLTFVGWAPGGSTSCCMYVNAKGKRCVLKIQASSQDAKLEIFALQQWEISEVVPKILQIAPEFNATLLQYCGNVPATHEVSAVAVTNLHTRLSAVGFQLGAQKETPPSVLARVHHRLNIATQRLTATHSHLLITAESTVVKLTRDAPAKNLIHGDFQIKNLLIGDNSNLFTIDPLLCQGDIEYDIALWCVTHKRKNTLADTLIEFANTYTDIDYNRLLLWARVLAVTELRFYQKELADHQLEFLFN